MVKKCGVYLVKAAVCASCILAGIGAFPAQAAEEFDPVYYGNVYPDVTEALGTDPEVLLNHYLVFGINEGRLPYEGAVPGAKVEGMANAEPFAVSGENDLVPMAQLANLASIQKKATSEELAQAYNIAVGLVTPYRDLTREEQLYGITTSIRQIFDSGMSYSMTDSHYNDPYGYFVLGSASCAGCTRATGLCLNILGIPYEHVNENQYSHQWCRVEVNGTYWICDAFGLYCGPEPAPYEHPYLR